MSIVKINAIEVPEGAGPELERRFAAQAQSVRELDGFEEFMLLRPTAGESRYFAFTRWASEEAYLAWRNGPAFAAGHGGPKSESHDESHAQGHGHGGAQRPVGTGASLLEFEVVPL